MKEILTYVLGVIACGGVFTGFYALALRRRVSFRTARIYLIASVVVSAAIPAFDIPVWRSAPVEIPVLPAEMYLDYQPVAAAPQARKAIDYRLAAVVAVYVLGAAGMLAAVGFQFAKIGRIRRRAHISRADGYRIAVSNGVETPFSFLSTVFVGSGTSQGELRQILLHEASHIRHRHSAEKIIMELLKTLLWFNPFAWIASRWLNEVHEFEADRDALKGGCTIDEYLPLIFRQVFGYAPEISTGLGHSLTKKRFEMMTKNLKHGRYSWLRTAGVLPAAAALMMLFGFTHRAPEIVFTEPAQATEIIAEQDPSQTYDMRTVQVHPEFPGGIAAFIKWVITEIGDLSEYTTGKEKDLIMEFKFTIMEDGSLDSVKVVKTPDKALSDKVVDVLKKSPAWEPGTVNGKPVRVAYMLPVTIRVVEPAAKPADGAAPKKESEPAAPQAGAAKPEQGEVIEEKADAAADETDLIDQIDPDQIKSITILKPNNKYSPDVLAELGEKRMNGVIMIEMKESAEPITIKSKNPDAPENISIKTNRIDIVYDPISEAKLGMMVKEVNVIHPKPDSVLLSKSDKPFIWHENEGRELESFDGIAAEQVESISVLKENVEYPQKIRDAMGDRKFSGVIVITTKEPAEPAQSAG